MGANPIALQHSVGSTRYKLPQSTGIKVQLGGGGAGGSSRQHDSSSYDKTSAATGKGETGNVSFLMKHRIRQAVGDADGHQKGAVSQI